MPLSFYLSLLAFALLGWWFFENRWRGWGIPGLAVLGTVTVWYVGDVFYNEYADYRVMFGDEILSAAWWQVLWFLIMFAFLVPYSHRWVNRSLIANRVRRSFVMEMVQHQTTQRKRFQSRLDRVVLPLLCFWILLMALALVRLEFDFIGLFMPYLGEKVDPWGRGRIGGGIDALLALASNVQILLTATFGVLAALSSNPRTRFIAFVVLAFALPYYLIDRVRNAMIAVLLPGFLSWVFLRLRGGMPVKVAVLAIGFLAVDSWFRFVMEARDKGVSVAAVVGRSAIDVEGEARHQGLNMFEELAWMNYFQKTEIYVPNWGHRYFAEVVNPIPRILWSGKPEVGLDYSRARGADWNQAEAKEGGVAASISTGMIGQGLANFGPFFGPPAAAVLMALWVALLARQDLLGWTEPTRLLLYALGVVLTFNMGRDITLLVLYPFFFGLIFYHVWKHLWSVKSSGTALVGTNRRSVRLSRRARRLSPRSRSRKTAAHGLPDEMTTP